MNADNLPSPGDINGTGRLRAICAKAISYTEILGSFGEGTSDTGTDLAKFFNACLTAANATATAPQGGSGGGAASVVGVWGFTYRGEIGDTEPSISWRAQLNNVIAGEMSEEEAEEGLPIPVGLTIEALSSDGIVLDADHVTISSEATTAAFEVLDTNSDHFGFFIITASRTPG